MAEQSFTTRLKNLNIKEKMIFFGGLSIIISVFLPWYQDIDRFKTGDTFYGITGPLYLAGFLIFLTGIFSFGIMLMKLLEKKAPKLPVNESYIHISGNALSILMLVLINSVYFHPKFGINLTEKTIGAGMILAIIGVGLVLLGSILTIKKKEVNFDEEGQLKPLIDINDRVQNEIIKKKETPENVKPLQYVKSINGETDKLINE